MEIYRASKSSEVFVGAHFTSDPEEAAVYTKYRINNGGDAFGGTVRKYRCEGDVLCVGYEVVGFIKTLQTLAEDEEIDFSQLGKISEIAQREADRFEDEWIELHEVDAWSIAQELKQFGIDYIFHVIEKVDGVAEALVNSSYAWIEWEANSIKEGVDWKDDIRTTTYRYLGGGSVELSA